MPRNKKPKHFKSFSEAMPQEPEIEKTWKELQDEALQQKTQLKPRTKNQERLINSILTNVITFIFGVAGSGKTWISCGVAAQLLLDKKIDTIVLSRPQIEVSNKSVGYLPGSAEEKMLPYMVPLIDALGEFLGDKTVDRLIKEKIIEILPIGLIRGRSVKNSIIIVDESQNLSYLELKTILTRIDCGSRLVLAGDIGQKDIDIHDYEEVMRKLYDLKDEIGFVKFGLEDVQRAGIVRKILERL